MKILFDDISSYQVEKLVINSLQNALYQAMVVIDQEEHVVWEDKNKALVTRNLVKMRERFQNMTFPETVLRQESAYDEMVGLDTRSASNRMEIPLGKTPLF